MKSRPAVVGAFILGALALGVVAILFFGGRRLFAREARVVVFFGESVAGLDVGAPVTFHGARIGRVQNISIRFSPQLMTARIPVVLQIDLTRVNLEDTTFAGAPPDFTRLVQAGLRAQLVLESIITGQVGVDLDFRPGTPAQLVGAMPELPEIPAVTSEFAQLRTELMGLRLRQLADSAERAIAAIERLADHVNAELDPLVQSAHGTLDAATHTLQTTDEAVRRVQTEASTAVHDLDLLVVDARHQVNDRGGELSRTLVDADRTARQAQTLLGSLNDLAEPRSQFRADLQATARDLAATASSLRGFAETIERNPGALLSGGPGR